MKTLSQAHKKRSVSGNRLTPKMIADIRKRSAWLTRYLRSLKAFDQASRQRKNMRKIIAK